MTPSAQCAVHPQVVALGTCGRCGNFMCDECSLSGSELNCAKCRALIGAGPFPFARDDHAFGKIWEFSYDAFKREWLMMSVAVLIIGGAVFAVSMVVQLFQSIGTAVVGHGEGMYVVLGLAQVV